MRRLLPLSIASTVVLVLASWLVALTGAEQPGNSAFQSTWSRTDEPVLTGQVSRTWMWGPEANSVLLWEDYAESPDGRRVVQYYDKARMEITDPAGDAGSIWYVTNGLLVVELVTGQLQTGDASFMTMEPAQVNVAGDADDPNGPTYASFGEVLDQAPLGVGQTVIQRISRSGELSDDPSLAGQGITVALVDDVTDHSIAAPFWDFMTSEGLVYADGQYVTSALFDNPYFATGRPIAEPAWASVKVAGAQRDVLIQCFERRCLTYTPGNSDGFLVEAGNVGQHYYQWRYNQTGMTPDPAPTPTATPTPAATATPTTPPVATTGDIQISYILWDSPVSGEHSGEYTTLTNYSGYAIQMQGWRLTDQGANRSYRFPSFILGAGASVNVHNCDGVNTASDLYTGSCLAWWNNEGDTGYLYDATGALVSTYGY